MIDTSKIRKTLAKRRKKIMKIDEMIDAGYEYVVVDDFEEKITQRGEEVNTSLVFHDAKSGNWFWGKGKDINDYIAAMKDAGADEEEIASTSSQPPELWRLSKVIQVKDYKTQKWKSYRPTEFMGYASEFEVTVTEKEMLANGAGSSDGTEGKGVAKPDADEKGGGVAQ